MTVFEAHPWLWGSGRLFSSGDRSLLVRVSKMLVCDCSCVSNKIGSKICLGEAIVDLNNSGTEAGCKKPGW